MKTCVALLMMACLLPVSAKAFDTADGVLLTAYGVLLVRDWQQTHDIVDRRSDGYREVRAGNLIGEHPTHQQVDALMAINAGAAVASLFLLPPPYNKLVMVGFIAEKWHATQYNAAIGLRSSF